MTSWAIKLSDVKAEKRDWLWKPRIPAGELTLVAGIQGIGKSILVIDMLSRITTGKPWPDGEKCAEGAVVLLPAEDRLSSTIRPRFDAARADTDRITIVRGAPIKGKGKDKIVPFILDRDLPCLIHLAQTIENVKVFAIDPIGSYMGNIDVHRENMVRNVMYALQVDLAEKYDVAVLGIVHLRKGGLEDSALSRILGSVAFTAAARTVWGVAQADDDPTRKLFIPMKHNLTAAAATGLEFFVVPGINGEGVVRWGKAIDELAEDAMTDKGMRPQVQREKAKKMLIKILYKGPMSAADVMEKLGSEEISENTIRAAKKELKIKSVKQFNGEWQWILPKSR